MEIADMSDITLYKFPFIGNNLLDFKNDATNAGTFSNRFHNNLTQFFSGISGSKRVYELNDTRAFKVNGDYMEIVLPDSSEGVRLYSIIEILAYDGISYRYYYFNINSVESLKDGVQGSAQSACRIRCSINYYYTFLYEIQNGLSSTQALYERHHIDRFTKNGDAEWTTKKGVLGSINSKFSSYITKESVDSSKVQVLWLYLFMDEDVYCSFSKSGQYYGKQKISYGSNKFTNNRRIFVAPYGYVIDNEITVFGVGSGKAFYGQHDFYIDNRGFFNSTYVVDAYVSNMPPNYYFTFYKEEKTIAIGRSNGDDIYDIRLLYKDSTNPLDIQYPSISLGNVLPCASCSFFNDDGTQTSNGRVNPTFPANLSYTKSFRTTYTLDEIGGLKTFNVENDPTFKLYPFSYLYTLNGEVTYYPTRFNEYFNCKTTSYYRTTQTIAYSTTDVTKKDYIFYLNFWENCDGFVTIEKDNIETFYRNNANLYKTKMFLNMASSAIGLASGAYNAANAFSNVAGQTTTKITQARDKLGRFSGGPKITSETVAPTMGERYAAAIPGGLNAASSALGIVGPILQERALLSDLGNAQNQYSNVTSSMYPNIQMMLFYENTPNKDSEEFKVMATDIYYYGYDRAEVGLCSENNRKIYDYKQVAAVYSNPTNIPGANAEIVSALMNGTTFWHLENLLSLTSEQKTQIATTCNKYGIANYEPELD